VEVKSKASGEVISLAVDTGDVVSPGQVLLQLLPRDAQNSVDQTQAELSAVTARLANARASLDRSRRLYAEGLLPAAELEADQLAVTNAESELVRGQKAWDLAAERLAETTVRSPIRGTVIAKSVEVGQVVSSAVSQVSGGTLLLTLADLDEVQVRSLVDEVDIGRIRQGLPVAIRVEAHADRQFTGRVVKIEPQAVTQQNVTLFPVLTRIDNREGLLKPGMNAEIEVLIDSREDVLKLPNEALKTREEAARLAGLLGLGGGEGSASGPRSGPGPGPGRAERAGKGDAEERVIFLQAPDGSLTRQNVTLGLRNWEASEIVAGLELGQEVALIPNASQLEQSAAFRSRMQSMRGMPGMGGGGRGGR
jgi:HlyD family secretion protein